ncbi:MAG TPA: hypothetical protein VED41_12610 [Solirubrobacteraceae bacterium]|nr:hypothetical protein [Solirubrobacteraceae bacterium]
MRTLKLTAALAALALAATGIAYASPLFKQISVITLTATKEGKPTGLKASLESSDAGAVQPQGLKTLTITLPTHTKFNFKSKAIKLCTAPEVEIKATLGKACPAKSEIGTGTAVANGAPVLPMIPEDAVAYAGKNQIVFLLTPATPAGGQVLVLYGKVVANKVTTSVPVITAGGLNIVITALNLTVKTIGSGSNAFITAGKCTAGKFVVKSGFLYQTGATLTLSSSSKCSK